MPGFHKQRVEETDRVRRRTLAPAVRSQLIADAARTRANEAVLDLREASFNEQIGPLTGAVDRLEPEGRLRVRVRSLSPATLAALQLTGERYQIVRNDPADAEFLVWREYTPEQRRRYFRQAVDGR